MFRFNSFETKHLKTTSIPNTVFKEAICNAAINYCSQLIEAPKSKSTNKENLILNQVFDEVILFSLNT